MSERFRRTEMLLGSDGVERLRGARVAVFGIGGVGGHAVEALARSGVGALDLIDSDSVSESNINRQIIALSSTVGRAKVEVMAERIADINPDAKVVCHKVFFLPETSHLFDFSNYDYVIDAIDTVSGKMEIIEAANRSGVPVISSMGTGNKLDPTRLEVADIYKTEGCPLARAVRSLCRKRGIKNLKVVYSREEPHTAEETAIDAESGKAIPASCAFVPSVAGLILASEVIRDLAGKH